MCKQLICTTREISFLGSLVKIMKVKAYTFRFITQLVLKRLRSVLAPVSMTCHRHVSASSGNDFSAKRGTKLHTCQ